MGGAVKSVTKAVSNVVKPVANTVTTVATGGALNTNGSGWLQGGSVGQNLATSASGGLIGKNGYFGQNGITQALANRQQAANSGGGVAARPGDLIMPEQYKLMASKLDPNSANYQADLADLKSQSLTGYDNTYDKSALNAMQGKALATGPSAWATAAEAQQRGEEGMQRNTAMNTAQGSLAQQMSNMAMRGGLSSGSRERMGMQATRDLMNTTQGIAGQGANARLGITSQDEQNKNSLLGQVNAGQLQSANYDTSLTQLANKQIEDQWKTKMGAWAASKNAAAMSAAANSGGSKK